MPQDHPFRRARRMAGLEISEIVQIAERAAAFKKAGRDVVSLATGEPDFPTPPEVIEAAHRAALAGQTRYTPTLGTASLREAVAADAGVQPGEVIISTGAKQVIANAMLATLDRGDKVVMAAPYWTSYSDIVAMAGGTAVVIPCSMEDGFKLRPDRLEAALGPETRWVMLNSPSNPSGAVYSPDEIRALAEVLRRHPHLLILVDEIYEHLSFVPFARFADAAPDLRPRMLTVNGASKAWSMTGWRIGWGIGPAGLIAAVGAVQGQITSGACSIAQAAAVAALTMGREVIETRRAALLARRDRVVATLNAIQGIECPSPEGAFYVFPRITGAMSALGHATDAALCEWLLETAGVAIVPGRAFGLHGHARLSFAYSDQELDKGLARIGAALGKRT
ncbi:MAG: pyridoxal phosphate-dependent aminotransferase [Tabrizicola sp.]|nr:pyridoxal phosphate-dependent aminotransferase [Tabrizicola sp.]